MKGTTKWRVEQNEEVELNEGFRTKWRVEQNEVCTK